MSKLRTVSWVLLVVVGLLMLVGSLGSAALAYRGDYPIGGVSISEVAAGREVVLTGLRGTRGTAAAWAAAFALLFLSVVVGPYRRGDVGAWWGILVSMLVLLGITALRIPLLGTRLGTEGPLILAIVVLVALLLDVRRLGAGR